MDKLTKTATYTINGNPPATRQLFVIQKNADGTFDLGTEDGQLIVGKCPADPAQQSYCSPNTQEPKK